MILISALTSSCFSAAGWRTVAANQRNAVRRRIFIWIAAKMSFVLLCFLWVRATFPRYRYDQVMRLGWKVFIPVTLVWIIFLGAMMQTPWAYLFH
jgi:NADH-quinone oxidoreductase subunit H